MPQCGTSFNHSEAGMTALTPRERMQTLLAKQIPDHMGLYEHFWPETLRDYWPEQGYPRDADPVDVFHYDLRGGPWPIDPAPFLGQEIILEETDEWTITRNGFGGVQRNWRHKSGTPEHIDFTIVTPRKWEEVKPNLQYLNPDRIRLKECEEFLQKARREDRFWTFGGLLHFELLRGILGDVCMLESFLLEPEWIADFCETYTQFYIRHLTYVLEHVAVPDGAFVYEDLGFSNGPFCSPKTYRELIFPHHKRIIDFFHDRGLPVIFHSCGDIRQMVPHLIDAGIDCLQPMEVKAGVDIFDLVEKFPGKLAYMGNMDVTVLNSNDPKIIEPYLREKIAALREKNVPYIFHSDHSIPPDIDLSTYRMMLDIYRQEGVYNR